MKTLEQAQTAFLKTGVKVTAALKERATAILQELRKDYPVTKLWMGMGVYSLSGGTMLMTDAHGEESQQEVDADLFDLSQKYSKPKGWTLQHEKLFAELAEICQFLTDDPHTGIFDIEVSPPDEDSGFVAPLKSEYDIQAEKFLTDNGLKFRATLSDSKTPAWSDGKECGHHFRVTISKRLPIGPKPARLVFDFWSSIADHEAGILTVTPYDVLACISHDACVPETFKDFCSEFGYESDSIKALQLFRRCAAFAKRLRAFFTEAELEQLSEIQ